MDLIIVDCQHDFICGSLACRGAKEALSEIVNYVNANDVRVFYSLDWHSPSNRSFKVNGGIWPVHCVAGEIGSSLSSVFVEGISLEANKPSRENMFFKGTDDFVEEYSAAFARDSSGNALVDVLSDEVVVSGIASEYCVRETVLELMKAGKNVKVLLNGIAYVDEADHLENISDLRSKGVEFI